MLELFSLILRSVSSRSWYRQILNENAPIGFLYIFILKGIVSIVFTIVVSVSFFAVLPKLQEGITSSFPADLSVMIKKGELSINKFGPYVVDKGFVIDVDASPTLATAERYHTNFLITRTHMVSVQKSGKIEIMPLASFPDMTINRQNIEQWVDTASAYLWMLPFFAFFGYWFFGTLIVYAMSIIYALIIWLLLRIINEKTTFACSYSVALYAQTISILFFFSGWLSLLVTLVIVFLMYQKK